MEYLRTIWRDLKRQDLIIIKLLMFLHSGSLTLLFPFLPLHMTALGFTVTQVSSLYAAISALEIITPLIVGQIASKLKNIRILLVTLKLVNVSAASYLAYFTHESAQNSSDDRYFFLQYSAARILLEMTRTSSLNLSESVMLMTLKTRGGDYGVQKVFGTLGSVVLAPVSGILSDNNSKDVFSSVLKIFALLQMISAFLHLFSSLQFETNNSSKPESSRRGLLAVLSQSGLFKYLLVSAILGTLWGFLETYQYIHLESKGYTKKDIGLSLSLSTISGLVVALCSSLIISTFGVGNSLGVSFICYSIRLIGCAQLGEKTGGCWTLLLLETLKPGGHLLAMIVTCSFIKQTVNLPDIPGFENLFSCSYFGIGKGLGSVVGGTLVESYGMEHTMMFLAIISALGAFYSNTSVSSARTHQIPEKINTL